MLGVDIAYQNGRFSDQVLSLISSSWTKGTKSQYKPYITKWCDYCSKQGLNPLKAPVNAGAEFLADLFYSTKLEYSALNTARSALSAVLEPVDSLSFGKQPIIKRLMRGIFKERPTLPKYTVTYDVDLVFNRIVNSPLHILDLKTLTFRVATLLCILSGQRSQTLGVMNINFMHKEDTRYIFFISELIKQSRPTFHQAPLEFVSYRDNVCICPVAHIQHYLEETKAIRGSQTEFFISYAPPYKAVKSSTIAKWVVMFLKECGVNTKVFSAHSTRSASTSKSLKNGLSLQDLGKAAGWSGSSTFRKIYNKPIVQNFGDSLLQKL